jgi:hypothetical protein
MITCLEVAYVVVALTNHGYWEPYANQTFDNKAACEEAAKNPDNRPHGDAKCVAFRANIPTMGAPIGDTHRPTWCLKAAGRN